MVGQKCILKESKTRRSCTKSTDGTHSDECIFNAKTSRCILKKSTSEDLDKAPKAAPKAPKAPKSPKVKKKLHKAAGIT